MAMGGAACSLVTSLDGLSGGTVAAQSEEGGAADAASDDSASPPVPTPDTGSPPPTGDDSSTPIVPDAAPEASTDAGPLTCPDASILCNGACVDPASDPANCNGCGNVCASGVCGRSVAAPMTTKPGGWAFNGTAFYNSSAPSAELTVASVNGQAGSFLYKNAIAMDGADVKFSFRIGLQGGLRSDGMGFLMAREGFTALGSSGGGLGMAGLTGYGVELDIYNNGECGDTNDDHVALDSLTPCSTGEPAPILVQDVSAVLDLGDTHWHTAEIALASGAATFWIDGTKLFNNVAMSGYQAGTTYFVGFSGGTGGLVQSDGGPGGYRQEVKDITITFPAPQCL